MMIKSTLIAGFLALGATLPAIADPVTDANFVIGTDICVNFGADAWFVTDRIEDVGWTRRKDAEYGVDVYDSPDQSVVLIPPATDAKFPVTCSIVSQKVSLGFAIESTRAILVKSGVDAIKDTEDGCLIFRTGTDVTIEVHNDGNEVMCDQPMTAHVNVKTFSNPIAGQ